MKFKVGKRIIKTVITVSIILAIYILLLFLDKIVGIDRSQWNAPSNMYTPFFAGVSAIYATHRDKKTSIKQAKIRSIGSIIGGYFGMAIVFLVEWLFITVFNLIDDAFILYNVLRYLIVTIALIPLIVITVHLKQTEAVYITCLTYLSVTISIRNGGMPVFQFATNRVLSTIIGVGVSLLINTYVFNIKRVNKDVLFVSTLENNFLLENDELTPFSKYKLNELYEANIPLMFATTRTPDSFEYIFKDVNINYPMITMNGGAKYKFDKKRYSDVCHIEQEDRLKLDKALKDMNMKAFVYTVNDHILHAYHDILTDEGQKRFYAHRKHQSCYTFVSGEMPSYLFATLYTIIDTQENIENFIAYGNTNHIFDNLNIVTYLYNKDINGKRYYYLRIYNKNANKENYVFQEKEKNNYNKLIVSASGRTDLKLIEASNLSMCLSSSPEHIKEKVDIVINGSSDDILRIFAEIYHSKNVDKQIEKIKEKYNKQH